MQRFNAANDHHYKERVGQISAAQPPNFGYVITSAIHHIGVQPFYGYGIALVKDQ